MNLGKRGDTGLLETVIFIALNIIFFIIMLVFVWNSGQSASVYEEIYAKQIALAIDNSKPGTSMLIDFTKGVEISKTPEIKIDNEKKIVKVNLKDSGGYGFNFFSDYEAEASVKGNYILLNIKDKNE